MTNTASLQQVPPASATQNNPRRHTRWIIFFIILALGAIVGGWYYQYSQRYEKTDDAFIDGHIIAMSPRVPGHVTQVHITDNQSVHGGDLLVELDPKDYLARLAQKQAAILTAKASVAQAQAEAAAAGAEATRAQSDADRFASLLASDAATKQQQEYALAAAQVAVARVEAARKRIAAAEALVTEAQADLEVAQLNVSYTRITAPADGRITRKAVEAGQYVQVGQSLMALVQPDVWVVANFKETQLTRLKPGLLVDIVVDAYSHKTFRGHIDSIQQGAGARFSLLPPENATGNYVKVVQRVPVKIVFDEPVVEYLLGPGMSVIPTVSIP